MNSLEAVIKTSPQSSDIMNPPGGPLMWLIVLMEIFMFGVLVIIVARYRHFNPQIFNTESSHLVLKDGVIFTVSLLLSGYWAAEGVHSFFANQRGKSLTYFLLSSVGGFFFLILKLLDFAHKSSLGLGIERDDFWRYYWLLMGFHFLHVFVGVLILSSICIALLRNKVTDEDFSVRGGVLFWHMCDIVWLIIFPLFYLGGTHQ